MAIAHHDNQNTLNNRTITNAVTGQTITFLLTGGETNGHLLEMEAVYKPGSSEPALHFHPLQTEYFTVVSGTLTVRIEGVLKTLRGGQLLKISRNQVHSMWNAGTEDTVVNWKIQPALDTEEMLRTFTGLANRGRTNDKGMPDIFQLALTAPRFKHIVRLAAPPYNLLRLLFFFIKPLALLGGYKATLQEYKG